MLNRHLDSVFVSNTCFTDYPFDVKKLPTGYFKSFGNKNPDKVFYVIWADLMGSGFFSYFSHVLCHLKLAELSGMIPVIDFKNFKTLYNEAAPVHDTENSWEYYFKPVSQFNLDEVYESKNVFFCNGKYPASMSYSITQVNGLNEIYNKHIFVRNYIEDILKEYSEKFNSKILGIHFRGQEMQFAPGHSFPPTEQQMIKYTDEIIEKYNIENLFLVTEEQAYLDLFIKRYGARVLYTDSYRTYGINAYNFNPRDKHRYLLGLNVLVDAYLLSMCAGILCGDSNVSEFARFVNNRKFEFVYNIRNGVNSSNKLIARYLYRVKKRLPSSWGGLSDKILNG